MAKSQKTEGNKVTQANIKDQIWRLASEMVGDFGEHDRLRGIASDARDTASEAVETGRGKRLTIMSRAAQLSEKEQWSSVDISAAQSAARDMPLVKGSNEPVDKEDPIWKTRNTFVAEIGVAMHPNVRRQWDVLVEAVTKAWDDEQAALAAATGETKPDTPIKNWKGRKYQAVMAIARHAKAPIEINGVKELSPVIRDANDVIDYAKKHAPLSDHKRVLAKIKVVTDAIEACNDEFPWQGFRIILDKLGDESLKKQLLEARASMLAIADAVAPVVTAPVPTPAPEPVLVKADAPKPAMDPELAKKTEELIKRRKAAKQTPTSNPAPANTGNGTEAFQNIMDNA